MLYLYYTYDIVCNKNDKDEKTRIKKMLAIRLPKEIEDRIESLAKATGRTKTYYAKEAILNHLETMEDVYLGQKRLEDVRAGKSKTIPLEQVMEEHGMES